MGLRCATTHQGRGVDSAPPRKLQTESEPAFGGQSVPQPSVGFDS